MALIYRHADPWVSGMRHNNHEFTIGNSEVILSRWIAKVRPSTPDRWCIGGQRIGGWWAAPEPASFMRGRTLWLEGILEWESLYALSLQDIWCHWLPSMSSVEISQQRKEWTLNIVDYRYIVRQAQGQYSHSTFIIQLYYVLFIFSLKNLLMWYLTYY